MGISRKYFKIKNNKSFNKRNDLKCIHINRDIEKLKILRVHFLNKWLNISININYRIMSMKIFMLQKTREDFANIF